MSGERRIHREAGQAVFVHPERRHAVTWSWGAGYPVSEIGQIVAIPGVNPAEYEWVPACAGCAFHGEPVQIGRTADGGPVMGHDLSRCHPLAGHVERSDDPTANLIEPPEPDLDLQELQRLELLHRRLQAEHVKAELERRLADLDYGEEFGEEAELHQTADQLALQRQKVYLKGMV